MHVECDEDTLGREAVDKVLESIEDSRAPLRILAAKRRLMVANAVMNTSIEGGHAQREAYGVEVVLVEEANVPAAARESRTLSYWISAASVPRFACAKVGHSYE